MKQLWTPTKTYLKKSLKKSKTLLKKWFSKKKNKRLTTYIVGGLLILVLSSSLLAYHNHATAQERVYQQRVYEREVKLNELHTSLQAAEQREASTKAEVDTKEAEKAQLQAEIDKLNADLQSKREKENLLARAAQAIAPTAHAEGGNCGAWIAAAGISDEGSAQALIARESGCNPYAQNASSGACGVAQELPCGKSGCSLGDGACQVRWMNGYVLGTYGSWANALGHSYKYNWY